MPYNPASLENLKPEKRSKGKQRHNFTLLPETVEWLHSQPNSSAAIDRLVAERSVQAADSAQFSSLLKQAWRFMAVEQVGKQFEGHPVALKDMHFRCFPYMKWKEFLELVGRAQGCELVPSREKNYEVAGRRIGAITF